MAELKTKPTDENVRKFLNNVEDEEKRRDCVKIMEMMKEATGAEPKMWGGSIVGFGDYHYKYESGREGDWFITGFSPRKKNLSLYLHAGFGQYEDLLSRLGKHKTGSGCLYITKLADVLEELIRQSVNYIKRTYKNN